MIGYLDMDVPVGMPIMRENDFRPRTEKATMNALQSMQKMLNRGKAAGSSSQAGAEQKGARP